jgi:hypothetical protein
MPWETNLPHSLLHNEDSQTRGRFLPVEIPSSVDPFAPQHGE